MKVLSYDCDGSEFCCTVGGKKCDYSVEGQGSRRYACALMLKYGNWDDVVASPEYKPIGDFWARGSSPFDYCRSFDPRFCCRADLRPADLTHDEWGRAVSF